MKTQHVLNKIGLGAATLALLGAGVIPATLAYAAEEAAPNATAVANVDSKKTADLIVHKHARTEENGKNPGNGKVIADTTALGDVIAGVKFCAQKVNGIDLSTNKGWEAVAALKGDVNAVNNTLDTKVEEATTGADGKAEFKGLALGLYKVTECDVTKATVNGKTITPVPAAPFLVTLPMTDPDNRDKWMYSVNVYPKNSLVGIKKTTKDKGIVVGEKADFTIEANVPTPEKDKQLDKFVVMDVWRDADKMAYDTADQVKVTIHQEKPTPKDTELAANGDYNVSNQASASDKPGFVKVTFTEEGLKKLTAAAKEGAAKVIMNLKLKITDTPATGVVKNWPFLSPSAEYSDTPPADPSKPNTTPGPDGTVPPAPGGGTGTEPGTDAGKIPPIAGDPVEIKLGKFIVNKFDLNGEKKNQPELAGATFQIYHCDDMNKPLKVKEVSEWTTKADTALEITGLQTSDFYDGSAQTALIEYCLVETKAPEGFEKLAEPIRVKLPASTDVNKLSEATVNVPNTKANGGFNLPLTGSTALIIVSLSGVAIIAGGVMLAWRRHRENA